MAAAAFVVIAGNKRKEEEAEIKRLKDLLSSNSADLDSRLAALDSISNYEAKWKRIHDQEATGFIWLWIFLAAFIVLVMLRVLAQKIERRKKAMKNINEDSNPPPSTQSPSLTQSDNYSYVSSEQEQITVRSNRVTQSIRRSRPPSYQIASQTNRTLLRTRPLLSVYYRYAIPLPSIPGYEIPQLIPVETGASVCETALSAQSVVHDRSVPAYEPPPSYIEAITQKN